ncbi:MAG: enoyl-CoA hydratase-related protein [Rhodocyclaceae bacterium]|nr:enoyl-CoA hydratase-related protein [Rhodocyclaceae bacterium]
MTTKNNLPIVRVERVGAFQLITFNQPEIRNPLGPEVVDALTAALTAAEADAGIRAIAIRGAGTTFSAGGSLGNFEERIAMPLNADGSDPIAVSNLRFGTFLQRLARFPKPVVVAAHGAAMGGGAGLVCAADIALACADTRFSFTETSIGLVPAQILPFVVGRIGSQRARRLMLTAQRFDATEALRLGVVDAVAEDMQSLREKLSEVLDRIGRCAPEALARTKRLALRCATEGAASEEALTHLLDDASCDFAAQLRGEGGEGVRAAREKHDPSWRVTFDRSALADW